MASFFIAILADSQASNPNLPKTIPALIMSSIGQTDLDLRQVLLGNVVLTGGGSLFAGFADRLATEMSRQFPHVWYYLLCLAAVYANGRAGENPCTREPD